MAIWGICERGVQANEVFTCIGVGAQNRPGVLHTYDRHLRFTDLPVGALRERDHAETKRSRQRATASVVKDSAR